MRSNLLSLQNTQKLMDKTQERLSTGNKVNSAIDNPTSYYSAQGLNNRASDLEALLDSMGQGIQTLKAANEGIESITSFVQQAKAVANTARDTTTRAEIKSEGSFVNNIPEAATGGPANTETVTLKVGDVELSYAVKGSIDGGAAADGLAEVIAGLQADGDYAAADFTIEANADNTGIVVKAKDDVKVTDQKISFDGGKVTGMTVSGTLDNTLRDNSVKQFNDILIQIDQLANDATYKGVNLLKNDELKVVFNEDRTSSLTIQGDNATSAGLGLTEATDWNSNTDVDATIEAIDGAISKLRNMASVFGNNFSIVQTRQDFTDSLVNVLTEGADNLTLADMNEESANMLALQTRQQLGVNSLSLASQAAQAILKLF